MATAEHTTLRPEQMSGYTRDQFRMRRRGFLSVRSEKRFYDYENDCDVGRVKS